MRVFPVSVDDTECDVFIWRPSREVQKNCIVIARFFHDLIARRLRLVNEIWIKDVELEQESVCRPIRIKCGQNLVSLDDFRRRIIRTEGSIELDLPMTT